MKKVLVQRFSLFCALAAIAVWVIGRMLGLFSYPDDGFKRLEILLGILGGMISVLALYEILRTFERSDEQDLIRKMTETVGRAEELLHGKIALAQSPSNSQEYIDLWSGFTEDYWLYNPSYQIEQNPAITRREIVEKLFVPRFKNDKFKKAFYLFFTGDKLGKDNLREFYDLMQSVFQLNPDARKKIEVKELKDRAAAEESEIYRGIRNGISTAVIKPNGEAFSGDDEGSSVYIICTDAELLKRFAGKFTRNWRLGTLVQL